MSKPALAKVGVVVPILNNFKGYCEFMMSLQSNHPLSMRVVPQWRNQVALAKAWNLGTFACIADGCDYILISNDDILLSPHTINHMVESFSLLPKEVVLVSANNLFGNEQMPDPYAILSKQPETIEEMSYSEHPNYSCFMIKADFFDKVGTFDENFYPAWFEDNDSHRRINLLGYKGVCTTYASCIHFGGQTSAIAGTANSEASRSYYVEKWGGIPYPAAEKFDTPYNDPKLTPKDWTPK
jgi:GT2 family glycosyltransferase